MYETANFLASRGHEVTVFANEWEASPEAVRFVRVPMRRGPGFLRRASFLAACTRALQNSTYDVLNTHGCICPFGGVFRVHSVHRAWLENSAAHRAPGSPARLKQRVNPLHMVMRRLESRHFRERRYKKLIALSSEVKSDLHRFYDVPDEDVVVIPNGFAPSEFNPARRAERRAEMRARLGLSEEHIALLFVANELERKGYHTILDALRRLKRPDLRLLVVGRPSVEMVRGIAAEAGVSEQVIACGSTRDVQAYHAASDLFVLPTQYEAFCLAILEALGSGLPVITTTVPGARDAIVPGVNGALISDPRSGEQLAEALRPWLERPGAEERADGISESVRPYRWDRVLVAYEAVLLEHSR